MMMGVNRKDTANRNGYRSCIQWESHLQDGAVGEGEQELVKKAMAN